MKTSLLNITLAILVFWTSIAVAQDPAPPGWRKIDVEGKFSFYLPANMRDTGRESLENLHREYTNGRVYLSFDYKAPFHRAYENRVRLGKNFQETELQVDGKKSFVFVYESRDRKNRRMYFAELNVGELPNGEAVVWMIVSSSSPQAIQIAKTIFRTLKFP